MLASVQKSRQAHTNATELRENRLAIKRNAQKKYVLAPSMSTNSLCVKTNYLEAYSEIHMFSLERCKPSELNHSYQGYTSLSYNLQTYSEAITRLYMSIYERMERCSIEGRDVG